MKTIIYLLTLILTVLSLTGCVDELETNIVPEGEPAVVTLRVRTSERKDYTRADNELDYKVTSLWIGVFNATTGELKGYTYHPSLSHNQTAADQWETVTVNATTGLSRIVALANFENRYAITPDNPEPVKISDALLNIRNIKDLNELAVTYDSQGEVSVDKPLNALLMYGEYSNSTTDGETHGPGEIVYDNIYIDTSDFSAPGAIHLRRLISHNIFNIEYNKDNISEFEVTGWRVCNAPNASWLVERANGSPAVNAGEDITINGKSHHNTETLTHLLNDGNKIGFEFWQLENRHTGLVPDPARFSETDPTKKKLYHYREDEFKTAEGLNTGIYRSLSTSVDAPGYGRNASFVEFDVTMKMKVDENGKPIPASDTRMVRQTFVVHLGYCENKGDEAMRVRDFNCRRNSRYTYNIKINNVSSMMMEANKEGELTPSLDGDISDISNRYVVVDSHFNVMNVFLQDEELAEFSFMIEAYDEKRNRIDISSYDQSSIPVSETDTRFPYLSWVEFRPTTGENDVAEYKPRSGYYADGKTYLLNELKGKPGGWYTMFINEYVYENRTADGKLLPGKNGEPNWHWFTDAPDRKVWLNMSLTQSEDKETRYHRSKYAVSQRSIQTYYEKGMENLTAYGVEHVNESSGLNLRNPRKHSGSDGIPGARVLYNTNASGRYLLSQFISGADYSTTTPFSWSDNSKNWSDHVDFTNFQKINKVSTQGVNTDAVTHHLPAIKQLSSGSNSSNDHSLDPDQTTSPKYIDFLNGCMNRNRDLDGDGKIDANEVRWFVPGSNQYIQMILGRQSLRTPVMNYAGITDKLNSQNGNNNRLMLACADSRQIWAMEGTSFSWWRQWGRGAPWEIRCVRYLGSNLDSFTPTPHADAPYEFDIVGGKMIVTMSKINTKSVRKEAFVDEWMPPHLISDQDYNRCYYQFEIAGSTISLNNRTSLGLGNNENPYWSDYISNHNPCSSLNKDGEKGWRVPNQKELSIMANFKDASGNPLYEGSGDFLLSCSYAYFDKNGYGYKTGDKISEEIRYSLKITTAGGVGTQSGTVTLPTSDYSLRCVRDVITTTTTRSASKAKAGKKYVKKKIIKRFFRKTRKSSLDQRD